MARCPECNTRMVLPEGVSQWSHIYCDSCGTKLEILNMNPLELETVYDDDDDDDLYELDDEDDEDWDDEDVADIVDDEEDEEDDEDDDDDDDDKDDDW
ncbi:MAG: hypothetical protein P1S60_01710 [Anaerolineae bacterium]|nr:hypothetical protein [Anaerolineae bacterium]